MSSSEELRAEAQRCYERGDFQGALERYRRLADMLPDDPEVLNDLGTVYFAMGRPAESRGCLVRALHLAPGHAEARQNLEMVCRATGSTVQAALAKAAREPAADGLPDSLDISVVVPVHSNFDALDRSLDALYGQSFPAHRYEVLLVANGLDGTGRPELDGLLTAWGRHFGERLRPLEIEPASIPLARNEGVKSARGRIIVQINEDTALSRTALAQHYAEHEGFGFDPRCVVAGGRKFPDSSMKNLFNFLYEAVPLYTPLHLLQRRFLGDHTWLVTCNLSCLRETYSRFGMFDPAYVWDSDTALGKIWQQHGVRFHVNTGILSYRLHHLSFDSWRSNYAARARYLLRQVTGKWPEQLSAERQGRVLECYESALDFDLSVFEREMRRLEEDFTGPKAFTGGTFMGMRLDSVQDLVDYLSPLLMRYKECVQYGEVWHQAKEPGHPDATSGAAPKRAPPARRSYTLSPERRAAELKAEAEARYARDDFTGALSLYHRLLRLKPDDSEILTDLGTVHVALGRPREGEHYYLEALEADETYQPARQNLEGLRRSAGRDVDRPLLQDALKTDPDGEVRPQVTVLLTNYRRARNLSAILDCLARQTVPVQVFLWNNSYSGPDGPKETQVDADREEFRQAARHPLVALCVESSRNMRCWPRWLLAGLADTEYICTLDDDLMFADARVLEDALWASRNKCPDGVVGLFGWQRIPGRSYGESFHVSGSLEDYWVDFVKGRFMLFRRQLLELVPLAHPLFRDVNALLRRADDFYVNLCISRGTRSAHLVPGILGHRYENLPEWSTGLARQPGHWQERDELVRRMFAFYEAESAKQLKGAQVISKRGGPEHVRELTETYTESWYRMRAGYRHAYHAFARAIEEVFAPKSLIDIGCGAAYIVESFAEKIPVLGVDGSAGALAAQSDKARRCCIQRDLTTEPPEELVGSLEFAVCIEVGEHLPAEDVDALMAWFAHADRVLFTAAPPGQGGCQHLNEQPPEYWRQKFARLGFFYDEHKTARWQESACTYTQGCPWVVRNAMFFERSQGSQNA